MRSFDPGFDAYSHTATVARAATADPYQLVLMLVDGLLDELARVEGHIQARNYERKGASINKCLQILGGLDSALDMDKGSALAGNLRLLYDYCGQQLFEVSVRNELEPLKRVEGIVRELREGWQAMANYRAA